MTGSAKVAKKQQQRKSFTDGRYTKKHIYSQKSENMLSKLMYDQTAEDIKIEIRDSVKHQ